MRQMTLSEMFLDMTVYPREKLDDEHVLVLSEAIRAGEQLPPMVVCRKSKRVVDGFHRHAAYTRVYGSSHSPEVVEREYENESALFIDAMRYNSAHGRGLNFKDRARCVSIADKLGVDPSVLSATLHVKPSVLGALRARRSGNDRLRSAVSRPTQQPERQQELEWSSRNGNGHARQESSNGHHDKWRPWRLKVLRDCLGIVRQMDREDGEMMELVDRLRGAIGELIGK